MTENEISKIVVDTAITVYGQLDPGILESSYKEVQLDCVYRVDKIK